MRRQSDDMELTNQNARHTSTERNSMNILYNLFYCQWIFRSISVVWSRVCARCIQYTQRGMVAMPFQIRRWQTMDANLRTAERTDEGVPYHNILFRAPNDDIRQRRKMRTRWMNGYKGNKTKQNERKKWKESETNRKGKIRSTFDSNECGARVSGCWLYLN